MIDRQLVRIIVEETLAAIRAEKSQEDTYSRVRELLRQAGRLRLMDDDLKSALDSIRGDPYARIIYLNYWDGLTLEQIAENLGVEVTTVSRNKKRLCLMIADKLNM